MNFDFLSMHWLQPALNASTGAFLLTELICFIASPYP
jgi:hypothetical protein